jgi:hypothetical protein
MKKKKTAEQKLKESKIESLEQALKVVGEEASLLKEVCKYQLHNLTYAMNTLGFSLVKTGNLSDYQLTEQFCESNNIELIGAF